MTRGSALRLTVTLGCLNSSLNLIEMTQKDIQFSAT